VKHRVHPPLVPPHPGGALLLLLGLGSACLGDDLAAGPAATEGTTTGSSSGVAMTVELDATAGEITATLTHGPTGSTSAGDTASGSGETGQSVQGYGDCFNDPIEDACLTGETCIDDAGRPPGVGVCALQGCAGADECPSPPPGGQALPACLDVTGDAVDECVLECSGGASCPTGMACFAEFVCVWTAGLGPGDFGCVDEDIGAVVGDAVAMGSTAGQGNDFSPSCVGQNSQDVQLVWTALAGGTYTLDTLGSDFDTVLHVREDCVGSELACNDDTVDVASQVTVELGAGQSVLVVIDGYGNSTGNYVLNIH
jgi:hypothetical protein